MGKQTIASKIVLVIFLIGGLTFFNSCKKAKEEQKKEEVKETNSEIEKTEQELEYDINDFYGVWVELVPGFDNQYRGFVLKKDQTAISVNVDTPLNMKWSVKGTELTFEYLNDSLKEPDTFVIRAINDTILKLKTNDVAFQLMRNDTLKIDTIATKEIYRKEERVVAPGGPEGNMPVTDEEIIPTK